MANIQLNVARVLLLGLEKVKWCTLWHKEDGGELKLTLHREMLDRKVLLPVVGKRLVESAILLLGDLLRLASPDGFLLVHEVPLVGHLLHRLFLLFLDLLNLGLVAILLLLLVFLVVVVIDFLVDSLLGPERDRIVDELRVLLHKIFQTTLLNVLKLVLLEVAGDLGAAAERLAIGVFLDRKGATGSGLPDVLLVVIVLGGDND